MTRGDIDGILQDINQAVPGAHLQIVRSVSRNFLLKSVTEKREYFGSKTFDYA